MHVCDRGGALVGGSGHIATDPADYVWTAALTDVGCGRLHCRECKQLVTALPVLADGGRPYRCGCTSFTTWSTLWLDGQPEDGPSGRAPAGWGCGGHAARTLPIVLDGLRIEDAPDWNLLLRASVERRLSPAGPAWLPAYPNAWLERLVATVNDTERARFLLVVQRLLTEHDTRLRQGGLDLAERIGLEALTTAVIAFVATGTSDWASDDHLARFVVEQLRRASANTPNPGEALRLALRHAVLSAPGSSLIAATARGDADWVADHAVALAASSPRARSRLLSALESHPEALARAQLILNA